MKGNEWVLYRAGSEPKGFTPRPGVAVLHPEDGESDAEAFRFVNEKFIVGKAFWIWWPMGRWCTLIR